MKKKKELPKKELPYHKPAVNPIKCRKFKGYGIGIVRAIDWWKGYRIKQFSPILLKSDYVVGYWHELSNGYDILQESKTTLASFRKFDDAIVFLSNMKLKSILFPNKMPL